MSSILATHRRHTPYCTDTAHGPGEVCEGRPTQLAGLSLVRSRDHRGAEAVYLSVAEGCTPLSAPAIDALITLLADYRTALAPSA